MHSFSDQLAKSNAASRTVSELSSADWTEADTEHVVSAAAQLAPILRSREETTNSQRFVPTATIDDLKRHGFFRLLQPRRYGGMDADFDVSLRVIEELARGCGSTAWVYGVLGLHNRFMSAWPRDAQDQVWSDDPDVLICSSLNPKPVRKVSGGYELAGDWSFSSGSDHSDWAMIGGLPDGAAPVLMLVKTSEALIIDDWRTLGLRGTGSKTLRFHKVFAPDALAVPHGSMNQTRRSGSVVVAGSLWDNAPIAGGSAVFASVMLGVARRGLDTVTETLRTRVARGVKLADVEAHHMRIGEVAAMLEVSRFYLHEKARMISRRAREGIYVTSDEIKAHQRDISVIMRRIRESVDLLSLCHSMWVYDRDPLQIVLRDIATASTHLSGRWEAFVAPSGKDLVQSPA